MPSQKKIQNSYECRFAVYVDPPSYDKPDMHLLKLVKHGPDGELTPEVKLVYDYNRPFWVAKKGQRNYKQHKEWDDVDNLLINKSPQSKLVTNIAKSLGMPWFKGNFKKLAESPYIYGAEILSTALIKEAYATRFPDLQTPYTVAVADVETDVVHGTGDILMMSITFKKRVLIAVTKEYLTGIVNVEEKFRAKMREYLGDLIDAREIVFDIVIVANQLEVVRTIINEAHRLKPDFLSFWNMDFDIGKIMIACEKFGVNPANIFSDPSVPKEYRYFRYKQGPSKKVTASGLVTPIKPAARWHTVFTPASFYVIDSMCAYKHVRTGRQEKSSYSLDNILKEEKIGGKLKFEEANHLSGLKWHELMQSDYKIEYMVYNVYDCIAIELLDEKTKDLAFTLPLFSGHSDFENFKSQPRRAADNLHFYCLSKGKVIGVTAPKFKESNKPLDDDIDDEPSDDDDDENEDIDSKTLSLKGWIVTLPAHLIMDNGLKCIEEFPDMATNFHTFVGDLDVSASYPNGGAALNISKETTKREMGRISGIDEYTQRMQGINLTTAGHVNAVEYCTTMFNFPALPDLLVEMEKDKLIR